MGHRNLKPFKPNTVFKKIRILVIRRAANSTKQYRNGKWIRRDMALVYRYRVVHLCCGEEAIMSHRVIMSRKSRGTMYCRICSARRRKGVYVQRPLVGYIPPAIQNLINECRDPDDPVPEPEPEPEPAQAVPSWPVPPSVLTMKTTAWIR